MRPGSRGYVGGGLQPPGTGMRMATGGSMLSFEKLVAPLFSNIELCSSVKRRGILSHVIKKSLLQ